MVILLFTKKQGCCSASTRHYQGSIGKDGRVDVVVADNLVTSVASAKEEAAKLKAKGVDGTIFSFGVFAWPVFLS